MPPRARRRTRGGQPVPGREAQPRPAQVHRDRPRPDDRQPARQPRRIQDQGPVAVLAMAAAGVDHAVTRRRVTPSTRAMFQAIALVLRALRVEANTAELSPAERTTRMKRLEGLAAALARTAARDSSLFELLADEAPLLPGTRVTVEELLSKAGLDPSAVALPAEPEPEPSAVTRQVVPQSAVARSLLNPFLAPDYSAAAPARQRPGFLADWELVRPLLRAFEESTAGAPSCMSLPDPAALHVGAGLDLMPHQAQVVAAVREGHRSFLLADEPGLGKTAQALLSAQAAGAFPLLVVVPNVVKATWAREAATWTPGHPATVIHGDGENADAFADVIIVNYDILDRHVGWLGRFGFRGMVIDEAHFIKNKGSQRSQHVLELSRRIRQRTVRPLLMALTGTPLINDIEDFLAIWEFLGWITDKNEVAPELVVALEQNNMTPLDPDFYPAARQTVIDLGIVRRRKIDVARDIPARRIADMPVELEGALGSSVREAERKLKRRLVRRYQSALAARKDGHHVGGIDLELVRQVCARELRDADENSSGENVFSMMRRIGQAKAELAADYTAQLSRSAGKVVFFAKHIDVMDAAEQVFAKRGIGYASIRGEQTSRVRQKNIDAFVNDDAVHVIVCSLTAAGVGINLQVASNVVLSELSWTAAEQTQAIDRVHRIGQDQPVTAWRIIAAQTIDARIAELIGAKEGLAARALDGSGLEVADVDIRLEAYVTLLTEALSEVA